MNAKGLFLAILLAAGVAVNCVSQTTYSFENLSLKGPPNSLVNCFLQDHRGFLWVGSGQGLFRYDGYQFKLWDFSRIDAQALKRSSIMALFEDHNKTMWMGTEEGLISMDSSGRLESYLYLMDSAHVSKRVRSVTEDAQGNIWLALESADNQIGSLAVLDSRRQHIERIDVDDLMHWSRTVLLDEFSHIWVASSRGVMVVDPATRKVMHRFPSPWRPTRDNSSEMEASSLYRERDGVMWATSYNRGLSKIRYDSNYHITFETFQKSDGLVSNCVFRVMKTKAGQCWISTLDGISVLDERSHTIENFVPSDTIANSISEHQVRVTYEDRSGNIWIGYFALGVGKVKPNKGFITLTAEGTGTGAWKGGGVNQVYADPDDNLYVAVQGRGIHKFDFHAGFDRKPRVTFYSLPSKKPWTIQRLDAHRLLISTEDLGLVALDERTRRITQLNPFNCSKAYPLSDGSVLVGEPLRLHAMTGTFPTYKMQMLVPDSATFKRPMWPTYSGFNTEDANHYWIATWDGDLYTFSPGFRKFIVPRFNPPQHLNICEIWAEKGMLWVAAFEGVFKFRIERSGDDVTLNLERVFRESDGLTQGDGGSDLFQAALQSDLHGNIWMGGQYGLSKIDAQTNEVKKYLVEDGIPSNVLAIHAFTRMKNGYLAFGTTRGAVLFHPDSLKDNETKPPVAITDFTVLNNSRPVGTSVELTYRENVMSFEFAALDYTNPDRNRYAYRMDGFDNDWVYCGARHRATYTNLDAGTYHFRVKASNNDGVWNETGVTMEVVVLPPPWKTWWAYSLYGVAFVLVLIVARNEILKRERLRNDFKLKQLEADKYHELDTLKSRFFANISHEFRTPLTLILGPVQKMLMEASGDEKAELGLIQRNAQRLLKLVNQLLDLSRLEAGTLVLRCQQRDIIAFARLIFQSFHSMAEAKGITYTFESDAGSCPVYFDADKLEKILNNLLSNAFKFTPANGTIRVHVNAHAAAAAFREGYVEIRVSDSGIGISSEHLEKVFDRFYQVDSSQTREYEGTGIGLALTKELVDLHRGKVSVVSDVNQGTVFTVQLPLGKSHLLPKEIHEDDHWNLSVESAPPVGASTREGELRTTTVMIVEDNADLRYYLKENLIARYQVLEATDGEDGLMLAFEKIPDLIVSDLMMPRKDGVRMTQQLKQDERTSHIPIILLTAKADSETKIQGLELGADDYISKPFEMKELLVRIQNLIDGRKRLQEKYSKLLVQPVPTVQPKKVAVVSIDERFVARVMEIVEKNMANTQFGVEDFAKEAGMSVAQLYRKLTALTGFSPNDFIRHMRLQRAADLLRQRAGNVSEVAYATGFNNLSYFSKVFKEKFGVSPSEFAAEKIV